MKASVTIHFPDGTREFRYPEVPLEEGDVLHHEGRRYRVLGVSENGDHRHDIATVELVSENLIDKLQFEQGALQLVAIE